jgi:hypothetical protein
MDGSFHEVPSSVREWNEDEQIPCDGNSVEHDVVNIALFILIMF